MLYFRPIRFPILIETNPMKHLLSLFAMLMLALVHVSAQVTFVIQSLPPTTPTTDSLFIAGSFNGWQPALPDYMLHRNAQGKWSITLAAQSAGTVINFKFTRGSWETVEKGPNGEEIADRTYTFGVPAQVDITIANWATGGTPTSTAAANVKVMDNAFLMPQFNRTRRIWLYFPPDYETTSKSYPVLYMHDGQNLFDAATSFAGEWEVDETLNKLAQQGKPVPIVVGVDNGGTDRIGEYTPWFNPQYGGGDGEKYMKFIVETLKPYIDQHYRTLPDREHTGIMGSSLGGLISHSGSLQYQDVFSKAGLFSVSYWYSDTIWSFTHNTGKQKEMRFYQLCGTNESTGEVADMQRMNDSLVHLGFAQDVVQNKIVSGGQHNEKLWREAFGEAYLWLFASYTNAVKEKEEDPGLMHYPDPVEDYIFFKNNKYQAFDTLMVYDMNGNLVKTCSTLNDNRMDVRNLAPGCYLLKGISGKNFWQDRFIKK